MAAILDPKHRVVSVKKVSTPEFDAKNDGYAEYEITAEVKFRLYSDAPQSVAVEELKQDAMDKLEHALS